MSDFFKRWRVGIVDYAGSPVGSLETKRVFMSVVVVGLFGGSIQRIISGDGWMFLVLFGFTFIMLVDLVNIHKQLVLIKKTFEGLQ